MILNEVKNLRTIEMFRFAQHDKVKFLLYKLSPL
jgi:hypothetical protein